MGNVGKLLFSLAVFGVTGYITMHYDLFGVKRRTRPRPVPPATPAVVSLPEELANELDSASDFDAPRLLREAMTEYQGGPGERDLRLLLDRRTKLASVNVREKVELILEKDYDYPKAVALAEHYLRVWRGTAAGREAAAVLEEARNEQAAQIKSRREEADHHIEAERYAEARKALVIAWPMEPRFRRDLARHEEEVDRIIRSRTYSAPTGPGPRTPADRPEVVVYGSAPSPPALPGYPHPDVKRLRDVRAQMHKALELFRGRRFQPAAKALGEIVDYYPDLDYVKSRREAVEAMHGLARHKAMGVGGLFHATSSRRKGKKLWLKYTFETEQEHLDWEELPTFPYKASGKFEPARSGVRGTGAMSYCHRGSFKSDVRIRCIAKLSRVKSFGLAFCQQDLESRMLILIACNHLIVEGENYVKKRPGHALLMFGKGTNNDVPLDSPFVGFIFKGASKTSPSPPAGGELGLSFRFKGDEILGDIVYKADSTTLRYHAHGDDGRSLIKARPTLFVLDNGVIFREIIIEGVLHPDFEKLRLQELLDLAGTLAE